MADARLPLRCLHTNIKFSTLGGAQSILRAHHQHDAEVGLDSRFLVYLEPPDSTWSRARFVDFNWDWSLRRTRNRIRTLLQDFKPDVSVYHTTLAMPYLADLDRSPRRLLYLHGPLPVLEEQLASRKFWVDGVMAVSDELLNLARSIAPHWEPERFHRIYAPIFPPSIPVNPGRPAGKPLVLGYSGRLQVEDKRVDRLPDLCRQLEAAGVDFRFEILGDGPERTTLEQALPDRTRVVFHGLQTGDAYWRILSQWDAIVFLSDREGTPVAQLEAMSLGVLPVVPSVHSGADAYARRVNEGLVYPIGDLGALTRLIRQLTDPGTPWSTWRRAARNMLAAHDSRCYLEGFASFIRDIVEMPAAPRRPFPAQPFPVGFLPLKAMAPLAEWRRRLRRLG